MYNRPRTRTRTARTFPVLSTMEFILHFPVLSTMAFMWFFCPVLSTMELIFVRYFLQWNLFFPVLSTMEFIWYLFRYFLQWNLYGTRAVVDYTRQHWYYVHIDSNNLDPGSSIREP